MQMELSIKEGSMQPSYSAYRNLLTVSNGVLDVVGSLVVELNKRQTTHFRSF